MAWGTTGLTEDSELKRVAAVRQYLYEQFPSSTTSGTSMIPEG